jgi:transposase
MQPTPVVAGVDVGKHRLVTCTLGKPDEARTLDNRSEAIAAWLAELPPGSIVAMEATGAYHRLLAHMAHAAGMRVYVLNARDVYFYAKALSGRAKTDRLDAAVIARYAAEHHHELHGWRPCGGVAQQLHELLQRRARVSRLRVAMRQRLAGVAPLVQAGRELDEGFERFFERLDAQVQALVASQADLASGVARLRQISGLGAQGSVALGALFSQIEFARDDALVAFIGFDPRPCDSGERRGRRRLSKRGPAWLRRQMYLAALAASRSKAFRPLYQSIKARGLAPTQALIVLARKLLRVALAVWRTRKDFDVRLLGPEMVCKKP